MKSILHRSFHYTSSVDTDLRKTFARFRREQAAKLQSVQPVAKVVKLEKVK